MLSRAVVFVLSFIMVWAVHVTVFVTPAYTWFFLKFNMATTDYTFLVEPLLQDMCYLAFKYFGVPRSPKKYNENTIETIYLFAESYAIYFYYAD